MSVSVYPIGSPSSVVADLTIPGAAYSEVSLSAADFGFSSAILGVVGLSSDGYSFEFDPESSVLKVFQVPAPELGVAVSSGDLANVHIPVAGLEPALQTLVSVLGFPVAGGPPVDLTGSVVHVFSEAISLSSDTSAFTLVSVFVGVGGPSGEITMGVTLPDLTFRVVAWGF